MHVRAAFTSSVKYDWQVRLLGAVAQEHAWRMARGMAVAADPPFCPSQQSLPEDLRFTTSFDTSQARVQWVPQEPEEADVAVAPPERRPTAPRPAVPTGLAGPLKRAAAAPPAADPVPPDSPQQLVPCPLAQPHWVSAFSGSRPTLLHWVPAAGGSSDDSAQRDEIVYAAGSLIVGMRPAAGASQRYLQGHVRPVRGLALSADGSRLASAEEGAGAAIRLWDFRQGRCLATVPGEGSGRREPVQPPVT